MLGSPADPSVYNLEGAGHGRAAATAKGTQNITEYKKPAEK